ncbi:MAG: hypothetical protein F2520_06905 [Actinobacteria bacterium]|uniref:Unannotated protein n=1 Tax=freshwater metagenome TaxID=449393 RepID=A0A6J5YJC5_9ZZZZ|nr:hypothetical protein [Actinomycetota bacterium]MTA77972.1 hypothetical protein [Actinomycetota bacterium]
MSSDDIQSPAIESEAPVIVDSSRCTFETLGDETLVIDTTTGTLFVLRGLAVVVWSALTLGAARPSTLVLEATARYGAETGEVFRSMFDGLAGVFATAPVETAVIEWPEAVDPPTFERFDDIADILTLDPIHDVLPEAGWPFEPDPGSE